MVMRCLGCRWQVMSPRRQLCESRREDTCMAGGTLESHKKGSDAAFIPHRMTSLDLLSITRPFVSWVPINYFRPSMLSLLQRLFATSIPVQASKGLAPERLHCVIRLEIRVIRPIGANSTLCSAMERELSDSNELGGEFDPAIVALLAGLGMARIGSSLSCRYQIGPDRDVRVEPVTLVGKWGTGAIP